MRTSLLKEWSDPHGTFNIALRGQSHPLQKEEDLDALLERIGDKHFVLLGEASHGTHEYYTWRAKISKRLIEEKGFSFVAVEGDWPDCYRLNRYVKNYPDSGHSAVEVLRTFDRWPTWMWANWEIVAFAEWLKNYNSRSLRNNKVGFYGLDVYSLWDSLETIIQYLDKRDPKTKQAALEAMRCFEPYSDGEGRAYAYATLMVPSICEDEVVDLLRQIRKNMPTYNTDHEAVMSAEQNAHVIVNAERYYRAMVRGSRESWNIRDHHMADTLSRLMTYYGDNAKGIIWEHNTHVGDARATDMSGMVNVGQLIREDFGALDVYIIGFGSYKGSVVAAIEWGELMQKMNVPEGIDGSWEALCHELDASDRIIFMEGVLQKTLKEHSIGHRAIGVVYNPDFERGNYVPSKMGERYDAFIYLDKTKALHPLHIKPAGHKEPETYPFGV